MTTMPAQSLPEIAEADAQPAIARIYSEIRTFSGAPMAALIWRHLATRPNALPEAWVALRPLFANGRLQEVAWQMADAVVVGPPVVLQDPFDAGQPLASIDRPAFVRVLDAYNRANPVNFIAVRALFHRLEAGGDDVAQPIGSRPWSPPPPVGVLPPMLPVSEMSPCDRGLIAALATSDKLDRSQVVPSLYRHLPHWPQLIPAIHAALIPRLRSGELEAEVSRVSRALDGEARKLALHMPRLDTLASIAGVTATLEEFSSLIPEMVVIGLLLRRGS